jgi:hypothetical protein
MEPDGSVLNCHPVWLGPDGLLVTWIQPEHAAMHNAVTTAAEFLATGVPRPATPPGSGGRPAYFFYPEMDGAESCGSGELTPSTHMAQPCQLFAMLADALVRYHAYSGATNATVNLLFPMFDYMLANGSTPNSTRWAWPGVPYASSTGGDLYFTGAADIDVYGCLGCGDGYGHIEPDKLGDFGLALLTLWKIGNDSRYREAAVHLGMVLARNIRNVSTLSARQSPWPFRVNAQTNVAREDYTASMLGPVRLLRELVRLGLGDVELLNATATSAWSWLLDKPVQTNWWCGYFEDCSSCPITTDPPSAADDSCAPDASGNLPSVEHRGGWQNTSMSDGTEWMACNYNQYLPLELALYVMEQQGSVPDWRGTVQKLVDWVDWALVENHVDGEPGVQWGARVVSEQRVDPSRMVSHTSRYAAVLSTFAELTHNTTLNAIARRSWDWASYMSNAQGRVVTGPKDSSLWFSDGYGDWIRNTLRCIAANSSWSLDAPGSHILRSSSVVTHIDYSDRSAVRYSTFDARSTEKLVLDFAPAHVAVDGRMLAGRLSDDANDGQRYDDLGWWASPVAAGSDRWEMTVSWAGREVVISSSLKS